MQPFAPTFAPGHLPGPGYAPRPKDIVIWRWWCCKEFQNMFKSTVCPRCRMGFSYLSTPHAHLTLLGDGRRTALTWHNGPLSLLTSTMTRQLAYEIEVRSALFLDQAVHAVVMHNADLDAAFDLAFSRVTDVVMYHAEQAVDARDEQAWREWEQRQREDVDEDKENKAPPVPAGDYGNYIAVSRRNLEEAEAAAAQTTSPPFERNCDMGLLAWRVPLASFGMLGAGEVESAQIGCLYRCNFAAPDPAVYYYYHDGCPPNCEEIRRRPATPPGPSSASDRTSEEETATSPADDDDDDVGQRQSSVYADQPQQQQPLIGQLQNAARRQKLPPIDGYAAQSYSRYDFARPPPVPYPGAVGDGRREPPVARNDVDATGEKEEEEEEEEEEEKKVAPLLRSWSDWLPTILEERELLEEQSRSRPGRQTRGAPPSWRNWVPIVSIGTSRQTKSKKPGNKKK